jgi:hypothetical protein
MLFKWTLAFKLFTLFIHRAGAYTKKKYSKIRSSPNQSTPHCQIPSAHLPLINMSQHFQKVHGLTPVSISSSRNSSVGTATRYRLDGLGFDPRWGQDFPDQFRPAPRSNPAFSTKGTGVSFPGVKRPGRGVYHSLPNQRGGWVLIGLYV